MGEYRGVVLDDLELHGARLTLRRWRPDDAAFVERALRSPAMHVWFALPDPYTAQDATQFVSVAGNAEREAGTGLGCAVVESASGRLLGSAELRLPALRRQWADIGYWLAEDAHGHGFAAEATRILADWAFDRGVPRLELRMDVANIASARTALAAGFTFDDVRRGVLGLPDGRHDLATFGRLATDRGDPVPHGFPRLPAEGLRDDAIMLRVLESGDALAMITQETDPLTVGTGFTGTAPSAVDVLRMAARAPLEFLIGRNAMFAIIDLASGSFAGALRLRQAGPPQIGGIGYAVHPDFRGRGVTARALRLLVPWAFEQADFARLELGAKTSNVASQRAALAGGFEPDGVRATRLRNPDGTFSDEVRFVLVNPTYG